MSKEIPKIALSKRKQVSSSNAIKNHRVSLRAQNVIRGVQYRTKHSESRKSLY